MIKFPNLINDLEDLDKAYTFKGTVRPESRDPEGMPHPDKDKPYVKGTMKDGSAAWFYKPEIAKKHEQEFMSNYNTFARSDRLSPEGKKHLHALGRSIALDQDRHAIPTGSEGNQGLRLRHLNAALSGKPGYSISEDNGIKITAPRHSGRTDLPAELHTWHFDGKTLKFLGKSPISKSNGGDYEKLERNDKGGAGKLPEGKSSIGKEVRGSDGRGKETNRKQSLSGRGYGRGGDVDESLKKDIKHHINLYHNKYPKAATHVDGREILPNIDNQSSIESSLNEYHILSGIREFPMHEINANPNDMFYAADDHRRVKDLSEQIKNSKQISPLIIAIDKEGPYILEGAHRAAALHTLGAKSFPAKIVLDTESLKKKSESLKKGLKGDWKKEGFVIGHEPKMDGHIYVYARHPKDPLTVGMLMFHPDDMIPLRSNVREEHQRKGIASAMYSYAEKITGKKMNRGTTQSDEAKAFWANKKRKFGKSSDLKKGSLQRKFKFNPRTDRDVVPERSWFATGVDQEDRLRVPRIEGNARERALHRLSGMTHTVVDSKTNKRWFLLHRGASHAEHKRLIDKDLNQTSYHNHPMHAINSWTPDHSIAASFANGIEGVISSYINEDDIHSVPIQTGYKHKDVFEKISATLKKEKEILVSNTGPHKLIDGVAAFKLSIPFSRYSSKSGETSLPLPAKDDPRYLENIDLSSVHHRINERSNLKVAKSLRKSEPSKHIATIAVISGDSILMGRRRDNNRFTTPGGHMESEEKAKEGALRELFEEAGVEPQSIHFIGKAPVQKKDETLMIHCFVCFGKHDTTSENDPDKEVAKWEWINVRNGLPKEVAENLHSPKNILLRFLGLQDE